MQFEKSQKVLFRHCDPAGIVFYPRYFEMVNDLVEAFFAERLDWPFEAMMSNAGVPTAEIRLRFAAPSRHGDMLRLQMQVTRLGRASMGLSYRATSGSELRFEGESVLVHTDAQGKPSPWPAPIRTRIETELDS